MRPLVNVLLCLATAAVVTAALTGLERPREVRIDTEYDEFLAHKDEVDLLFFGSSRFYRGIIPEDFDREMGRRGREVRSFNLGMRGMLSHEVNELLRRALATKPAHLRWIVVELGEWTPLHGNFWTDRAIAWHDWTETESAVRSSWLEEEPWGRRATNVRINLVQFGARTASVGVAAEHARRWFNGLTMPPSIEEIYYARLARQWQGFAPFSVEEHRAGLTGQHYREFQAQKQVFVANVATLPQLNAQEVPLDFYNLPALEAQIETAREAGVEIIFVIMPSYEPVPRLHRLADAGHVPNFLAFDDPTVYPKLYRPDYRFDRRHLNLQGAKVFTPLLAERVSALLADE